MGVDMNLRDKWFVNATIPEQYCATVAEMAADMLNRKSVDLDLVQKLAGKAGWAAGVAPVIWSFVAPLWAASADAEKFFGDRAVVNKAFRAKKKVVKIGMCRMRPALAWLLALFGSGKGILTRRMPVRWASLMVKARMYVDASPWGFGAFLAVEGSNAEYLHGAWDERDCERFGLKIGDCAGQAIWEALALLIALRAWAEFWLEDPGAATILAKSDSKAALGAFEKQRSKSPHINLIARELALDRALAAYEPRLELAHVRGKRNEWADALSRLAQPGSGAAVPGPLRGLPCRGVGVRGPSWWRTDVAGSV
jgi:hypothetical protein